MVGLDHHFLIVTIAIQGQINPARHLARRLARTAGVRVTLAIPVSSHRRMFPSSSAAGTDQYEQLRLQVVDEGQDLVSYAAYSDGFDQGFHPDTHDGALFMAQIEVVGSETLIRLARSLAHPVTCILYTFLSPWAADVARDILGVPSVLFWTQPAAVFSIYYHYFHGHADVISAHKDDPSFAFHLPGLPQLHIKDLPSILTDAHSPFLDSYGDIFMKALVKEAEERPSIRPRVLINTFHALEADAIESISTSSADLNLISVGPIIEKEEDASVSKDLFEQDKSAYLEWLEMQEEGSVVYISFGSLSKFSRAQMEEIWKGLKESRRPYLWVVRRDVREGILSQAGEGETVIMVDDELINGGGGGGGGDGQQGMVVEWCNQVRVLSHPSVGCFVTHCGWNSTMESIVCGVPMVMVPQWIDQATNAKLVEAVWGTGVRAEVNGEGVMEGRELKRCLDVIMGDCTIRNKAVTWRDKASEAVANDGPSFLSLVAFVDGM